MLRGATRLLRKTLRSVFNHDPSFCDMHEDAHARSAAKEYLSHIRSHLAERFGPRPLSILDAGCQAGRLLIPLAEDGHAVIGVDTSGFALRRAAVHARARRLAVTLHRGGIAEIRRWVPRASLDVVICTEVLYLCRDYRALFTLMKESIRPGGLLCVSHRPKEYYLVKAMVVGRSDACRELASRSEGGTLEGDYYNWQTPEQLRTWYQDEGLSVLGCYPVDVNEHPLQAKTPVDPAIQPLLGATVMTQTGFRMPSYYLVIAQTPSA